MRKPTTANQPATAEPEALQRLADRLCRAGLREPACLALQTLSPVAFLSSQLALFVQPFLRGSAWQPYADALTHETSWETLQQHLERNAQANRD
ncbi:MAG: hypothetical protein HC837_17415 [Chloroflexaceae bacterium]|nr:hypothetical protein [Chloroflexaceae bacterium]